MMTDFDEDFAYEEDPIAYVMQRQRERSKISYSCNDCGYKSNDEWLTKSHSCDRYEESVNGHCVDWPCCGHESGDCFGQRYGSDESIKQLHVDLMNSGLQDYEIDAFYERMDGGY